MASVQEALDPENFFDPKKEIGNYPHDKDDEVFPLVMPKVLPPSDESYICTPIKLQDDVFYITGFTPKAEKYTAHHMLLYGCSEPGTMEAVWNCGEMASSAEDRLEHHHPCKRNSQIMYGWAMDADEISLPENVGFRVGKSTRVKYLVLQVHYNKIDKIPEEGDSSGILLHFTRHKMEYIAGVLLLGTSGFAPPHSTTFFETACEMADNRKIEPFFFRVHTHKLGRVVSGYRVRNNTWDLIGKRSPQLPQVFSPVHDNAISLEKGDVVAARCTMVNDRDHNVWIGATNQDEMCNFYIMYKVKGETPVHPDVCFSPGPPEWSFQKNGGLRNVPDSASTLDE